ncbi:hypothetical protein AGRA3207_005180 [Actinomadura graeca]|uniref:Uncharacterized protein n=1 Tax=Actinomadura graeca TaxID=2750812 RepID=A0ABX8QYN5_9ACTN|nr:hypothetical protein [Actinomadura graeca]QXJ23946.1 hypothetical protein AGRA3207_005180 [Actinomadura graeca]
MSGDPTRTRPDPPEADPQEPGRSEPAPPGTGPSRMRPRDRRVVQAIALATLLPVLLVVRWVDETHGVHANLKPEEKATTVPRGETGVLGGAQWRVVDRRTAAPLTAGSPAGASRGQDVVELRLTLAVRPLDAAGAKTVGSYGIVYRLREDGGGERAWSATGLMTGAPRPGVAARLTVRGTVPRAMAGSLVLEVRPPAYPRGKGPLPLLRFAP